MTGRRYDRRPKAGRRQQFNGDSLSWVRVNGIRYMRASRHHSNIIEDLRWPKATVTPHISAGRRQQLHHPARFWLTCTTVLFTGDAGLPFAGNPPFAGLVMLTKVDIIEGLRWPKATVTPCR